jgi:hypothetical protein
MMKIRLDCDAFYFYHVGCALVFGPPQQSDENISLAITNPDGS